MPRRSSPERTERALSPSPAQNLLQPARIAVAAGAENGGIDGAGSISRHQLAALHAFHVDDAHMVAGVDRHGDGAPARHGVSLFARREGAGPHDDRGPRRPWPDSLVAGQIQN